MQDADVPIWDKGDRTDDYAKGGGNSFSFFDTEGKNDKLVVVDKAYELVLGRKPTSRELSFYRYAPMKEEELFKKLLNGEEHKDVVKKGREYPELEEREKLDQSAILKLKHSIEDKQEEFDGMKSMLEEKNREINNLRNEKNIPFISQSFFEKKESVAYYGTSESYGAKKEPKVATSFIDKLFYFIQNLSK